MTLLKKLEIGDCFWRYTDAKVMQYEIIKEFDEKFTIARELETNEELRMSNSISVFLNKNEALESFIDEVSEKKENYITKKREIENIIKNCDSILDEHVINTFKYPAIGDEFYWKDYNGRIHKNICYSIEYDREGFYEPYYRIKKDSYGAGSMVSQGSIVEII